MKVSDMTVKELNANKYLKVMGIIEGAFITPLAREVKVRKRREGDAEGPLNGKLTCPISLKLRGKFEKGTMKELAKRAGFSVKDTVLRLFINQNNDVDTYFRQMSDIKEYRIKVDIVKRWVSEVAKFRVGRDKNY